MLKFMFWMSLLLLNFKLGLERENLLSMIAFIISMSANLVLVYESLKE